MAPQTRDPFDDLLTLEDTLYTAAHTQGVADGARAGRIEGRIFGLERGFDKFSELGELHGRGAMWGARLAAARSSDTRLPALPTPTPRLQSNISLLYHLADPLTFDTSNTEASVADFDDRVKRAGAKAKVIERIIGETSLAGSAAQESKSSDRGNARVRIEGEGAKRGGKKGDDSMEDFMGSRLIG